MTNPDQLIAIFFEAAHRASIIPLASETTLYAMKSFGGFAMELPVAAAIVGGLCGHGFNLLIGRLLMRLPSSPKNQAIFQRLQQHFNRYGFILLVFAFAPLGNILAVAAGMLGTPFKKALPAIALGLLYFYATL
jgi:membrane protein YqaA with SNARE-associated domain